MVAGQAAASAREMEVLLHSRVAVVHMLREKKEQRNDGRGRDAKKNTFVLQQNSGGGEGKQLVVDSRQTKAHSIAQYACSTPGFPVGTAY